LRLEPLPVPIDIGTIIPAAITTVTRKPDHRKITNKNANVGGIKKISGTNPEGKN
jgi:hypothetical protein